MIPPRGRGEKAAASPPSKSVTDLDHVSHHEIAAELIGQMPRIVKIELRLEEKIAPDVELQARSTMQSKVTGVRSGREAGSVANSRKRRPGAIDTYFAAAHPSL